MTLILSALSIRSISHFVRELVVDAGCAARCAPPALYIRPTLPGLSQRKLSHTPTSSLRYSAKWFLASRFSDADDDAGRYFYYIWKLAQRQSWLWWRARWLAWISGTFAISSIAWWRDAIARHVRDVLARSAALHEALLGRRVDEYRAWRAALYSLNYDDTLMHKMYRYYIICAPDTTASDLGIYRSIVIWWLYYRYFR